MATMNTTTTTKPSQSGTRYATGGQRPIKPLPKTQKQAQKKPVSEPIKTQLKLPSATPKPIVKSSSATKAASTTTTKLSSENRKPTVSTAQAKLSSSTTKTAGQSSSQSGSTGNWINRNLQNRVAGVGNYAGGLITSVGDGVNRLGDGIAGSITDTTRRWGQGVSGYGNNIKDQVGVGGPRVATAGNPLGLAGQGASVKSVAQKRR